MKDIEILEDIRKQLAVITKLLHELKDGYKKTNFVHGESKTGLYIKWTNTIQKCYNEKSPPFQYFGKKEIKMYKRWRNSYVAFKNWAEKNGYKENLVLDRIDLCGNFTPNNCEWVTRQKFRQKRIKERKEFSQPVPTL